MSQGSPYNDALLIANASCAAIGIFTYSEAAFLYPQYSMHVVEESDLLSIIGSDGLLTKSLDSSISVLACNGLDCDAGSGRWAVVQDLDQQARYHVISAPYGTVPMGRDTQNFFWMMQAFPAGMLPCVRL